ncbi:MAG: alpha/beta hydrolase-fold protein [Rheinheimera sp.]|nr:alpha/beta hydrolase-fold protein [Rheinheimera sp.]
MRNFNLPGTKPGQTWLHSLLALLFFGTAQAAETPAAVSLPGTAVHELQFQGRSYPLWVDVPPSCQQRKNACPLLLVTDAPYAFPLIRSIRNRVGQQGRNIEDFILAGLAYPATDTPVASRSRDYTPTNVKARAALPGEDYGATVYGNAPAFAGFVAKQVLPLLQQHYRINPQRQIYLGHSYGGLFGAYLVLHQPTLFSHYVLSSPSLWFDKKQLLLAAPALLAAMPKTTRANVWLYSGSFEQPGPTARHYVDTDLVGDMQQFAQLLQAKQPGLKVQAKVLADEDHLTVFPSMVTRAMLEILPGAGPYTGG